MLRIFNTLTRCKEQFEPLEAGHVGMYTCGPTVYRFAHIGNLRSYLLADWLRRTLEGQGYRVTHVKNITDVGHMRQDMLDRGEDKVIAAARAEGKTPQEIAQFYTDAFMQDEARLQVLPAHIFPRATDNVSEMVDLTRTLFEKGFAYERRGNVYFEVERFPEYGKLSGQVGEGLAEGMRAAADPLKKSQRDFALWKAAEPGRLLKWPSPWGDGFPGWHIECSAMSRKYLGQQIDIHTGGVDNVFPHHEDEIAQSEAAFGKPFVGYWVHGQHLLVDGLKMAKSTGNTYTLEDLERRGFEPLAFRYLCATVHYRSRMNFTFRSLAAAQRGLLRLRGHAQAADGSVAKRASREADRWRKGFQAALNDDLNLPRALAAAWQVARDSLPAPLKRELLLEFDRVLGLDLDRRPELPSLPAEVERLAAERTRLRRGGDYARADELRARVIAAGFEVRDGRDAALILPAPAWARPSAVISSSQDVPSRLEEPAALEWTVVLVAREDRAEAERCLTSVLERLPDAAEVIAVDNGSTDDTSGWLDGVAGRDKRVRVFHADHNLGAAAARNVGLRQARGQMLVLLDSSVEVTGDAFSSLGGLLSEGRVGVAGRWGLVTSDLRSFDETEQPGEVDAIEGYIIALRRELVREVGLLDEKYRFYRHLDLDLSFAVRSRGYRLVIDTDLPLARHQHGEWERTPPEERDRLSKRNFYRFLRKWGDRTDLLLAGAR